MMGPRSAGDSTKTHLRVAQHAYIQVGIAQPGSRVLQVLDGPQHNLRVEVVCNGVDILALDGQLRVEERQVELQLTVPCSSTRAFDGASVGYDP